MESEWLPSYLFAFVAGPFKIIEYKNEYGEFKYPLKIYYCENKERYVK